MTQKTYVAEYSPSQGAFHVHTLSDRIASERRALENIGHPSDYLVLGEFNGHQPALEFIERNRDTITRHGFYFNQDDVQVFLNHETTH